MQGCWQRLRERAWCALPCTTYAHNPYSVTQSFLFCLFQISLGLFAIISNELSPKQNVHICCKCTQYTRIILSNNLSWSNHYDHIHHNAYRSLYLIRLSFSSTLPVNPKKQLYLSLVRSHLTYCSQIWRPRLVKDIYFLLNVFSAVQPSTFSIILF